MIQTPYFLTLISLLISLSSCQHDLGSMESWGFNGVSSDDVTLMSEKKIKIENLRYTGEGPAAWFMVGKDEDDYSQEFTDLDGVIIPDENGGCDRLGRYRGEDIELTLPGNMKFTDYSYLSIYCIRFSHNFGYIPIKKGLTFAPKNVTTAPAPPPPPPPPAPPAGAPGVAEASVAEGVAGVPAAEGGAAVTVEEGATDGPVIEAEAEDQPQSEGQEDLPNECPQDPETRGGSEEEDEEEEDEE